MPHQTNSGATVYKAFFEIDGPVQVELCRKHFEAKKEARLACFAIAAEFGADSYFPYREGGIRGLAFDEVPKGWREISAPGAKRCCIPKRTGKDNLAASERLRNAPKGPEDSALAEALGFPEEAMFVVDGNVLYRPAFLQTEVPRLRVFAIIGWRTDWTVPPGMVAVPEGELHLSVAAHNAAAKRAEA